MNRQEVMEEKIVEEKLVENKNSANITNVKRSDSEIQIRLPYEPPTIKKIKGAVCPLDIY